MQALAMRATLITITFVLPIGVVFWLVASISGLGIGAAVQPYTANDFIPTPPVSTKCQQQEQNMQQHLQSRENGVTQYTEIGNDGTEYYMRYEKNTVSFGSYEPMVPSSTFVSLSRSFVEELQTEFTAANFPMEGFPTYLGETSALRNSGGSLLDSAWTGDIPPEYEGKILKIGEGTNKDELLRMMNWEECQ